MQVAPRHVEADRIAVDQGVGTLRRDANAARTDGNDELDFVVVVFGGQRVLHMADIGRNDRHDRIRRLGEKERRLLGRIATHFPRVLRTRILDGIVDALDLIMRLIELQAGFELIADLIEGRLLGLCDLGNLEQDDR